MALQSNFFGNKRDTDTPMARPTLPSGAASVTMPTPVTGSVVSGAGPTAAAGTVPRDPVASAEPAAAADNPSKLTVGPNIKLKGVEITDCDTLVVEGLVEATMDSRVMQVEEAGAFKGSAQVDFAEIRGLFEGTLNARTRLVIRSTGKVTGNVRYGSVVIEEGGQLGGEVHFGAASPSLGSSLNPSLNPGSIIATSAPARLERVIAA